MNFNMRTSGMAMAVLVSLSLSACTGSTGKVQGALTETAGETEVVGAGMV